MRFSVVPVLMGSLTLGAGAVLAGDSAMGEWEGKLRGDDGVERILEARVVAEGGDRFRAVMRLDMDGAWNAGESTGRRQGETVVFSGSLTPGQGSGGVCRLQGQVDSEGFRGTCAGSGTTARFSLARMERRPPRLGAEPPEKAVVLFDGTGLDAWMHRDGQPAGWKLREDGSMEVTRGNILTRRSFGDVRIHLEFRTPLMAEARGQARGNSGVYVQGRYEVQVLDSFGLEPMDNGCGGVYRIAPPRVNASLPPLQWQTYEIVFRSPRFDSSGGKTANAKITVRHNGEVIHLDRELPRLTPGGVSSEEGERGPLLLQDHRDPVQYRNIWVVPLD
ncbi:MAG: DUF1080 domain-containing protein [Acidobacteria bacterium]|nr:DUF1080 domain-containing protein [Acidobacteriota bacterium]MYC81159.1 DUF1080 domain-containing protein [Acidobacteriota bacterium]